MDISERNVIESCVEQLTALDKHLSEVAYDVIRRWGDDSPEDIENSKQMYQLVGVIRSLKELLNK